MVLAQRVSLPELLELESWLAGALQPQASPLKAPVQMAPLELGLGPLALPPPAGALAQPKEQQEWPPEPAVFAAPP